MTDGSWQKHAEEIANYQLPLLPSSLSAMCVFLVLYRSPSLLSTPRTPLDIFSLS